MSISFFTDYGHMSKQRQGRSQMKPVWDTLAGLSGSVSRITQIPAMLIPFLRDQELLAKLADRACFDRLGATLQSDIQKMTQRLSAIKQRHEGRTGSTGNHTEWMEAISLSEEYIAWAGDFDAVVIPTFVDMVSMLQAAGANVSGIETPSATALVQ